MASTNDSSLRLLAEICSNLPYLAIRSPDQLQKRPLKRPTSSPLYQNVHKKRRMKLNTSLLSLFDQQIEIQTAQQTSPGSTVLQVPSNSPSPSLPTATSTPYRRF